MNENAFIRATIENLSLCYVFQALHRYFNRLILDTTDIKKKCLTILFRGRVFSFAPHGSHVVVNTHKFQSSKMILQTPKSIFLYSTFLNVYLETRIITIGAELVLFLISKHFFRGR